jgi:hypothetical protein
MCSLTGHTVDQTLVSKTFLTFSCIEYFYITGEYFVRFQDFVHPKLIFRIFFYLNLGFSLLTGIVGLILDILSCFGRVDFLLSQWVRKAQIPFGDLILTIRVGACYAG